MEFKIGSQWVGDDHPTYFIADIAANHDGNLARARNLIQLAKEAGADAAKFQNFQATKIVSDYGSVSKFCDKKGFNKSTLSRVFNRSQNLSLTHYIKILVSLEVLTPDINTDFDANLTVVGYLEIDHNSVSQSFLTMIIG